MRFFSPHLGIMKRLNNILGTFKISGGLAVPNSVEDDTHSIQAVIADNIRQACMTLSGSAVKPGGTLIRPDTSSPSVTTSGTGLVLANVLGITPSGDVITVVGPLTKTGAISGTSVRYIGVKYVEAVTSSVTDTSTDGSSLTPEIGPVMDPQAQFIVASSEAAVYDSHTLYLGYLTWSGTVWVYTAATGMAIDTVVALLTSRVSSMESQMTSLTARVYALEHP